MNATQFVPSFDGHQMHHFDPAWNGQQRTATMAPPAYPTAYGYAPPPQSFYPAYAYGPYSAQPSPVAFTQHRFAPQGYSRAAAPPPYRAYEQSLANGSYGYGDGYGGEFSGGEVDARVRSDSRGRWEGTHGTTIGVQEERNRFNRGRQDSTVLLVDHDHPSFGRPPHRSNVAPVEPLAAPGVEYQLIPNTCAVPPPPPVERSAVPLADLATEMVWAACVSAAAVTSPAVTHAQPWSNEADEMLGRRRSPSSRSLDDFHSTRSSSTPRTPELYYGAIGEGRRSETPVGADSEDSSPSSSSPCTPISTGMPGLPNKHSPGYRLALGEEGGIESSIEAIRVHAQKLNPLHQKSSTALPVEPSPAFRQFVTQILTATLVAPEDIVLALCYISTLPASSMIPPTPATATESATVSAIKAAPFKLVLGALMLANKTLQDNSYRNETFATVSGIPLRDVNALEVYIFCALKFDVAVQGDAWNAWLKTLIAQHDVGMKGNTGNRHKVSTVLQRLLQATGSRQASPLVEQRSTTPVNTVAPSSPVDCTPPNSTFLIAGVNLDASGPLRSPLRFLEDDPVEPESLPTARYVHQQSTPSRISSRSTFGDLKCARPFLTSSSSYPVSCARSFGKELNN